MKNTNFNFSKEFLKEFIKLTQGILSSEEFELVTAKLEAEAGKYHFTNSSEANLLRIFSSVYDKLFFFLDLNKYPHNSEIIIAITANSNYLTDIVVRNPEYLYQIFDQNFLSKIVDEAEVELAIEEIFQKFSSFETRLKFIRLIKKRMTLKIGINDILNFNELAQTTSQLSALAKVINGRLFDLCYNEVIKKYSIDKPKQNYCLCSLGKLGGYELNYSSDVDLILMYDFNSTLPVIKKEFHELLSEAALLFIKSSSELTPNGYIYRVDFRLRPDGKYSPMCKSITDYIKYYETRGEDWEKQMMIKLGFIGGSFSLYQQFANFTESYIYQTSFSSSIKNKIKMMKQNIERQHAQYDNVKTFKGGIRDIEFTLQALQLLNGGRFKTLRTGNSLAAISGLWNQKLLKKKEKETLTLAYIFYRKIEHYLQLMNDLQTHVIPNDYDMQMKIARYIGFNNTNEFKTHLSSTKEKVRAIFESILKTEESHIKDLGRAEINFNDNIKAERDIKFLRNGTGILERKEFDSRTIELFARIEQMLFKFLSKNIYPDIVLENLVKVIRSTKFCSIWYQEFLDKKCFENFLRLCLYSQRAIDLIISNPALEEFFLSRQVFIKLDKNNLSHLSVNEIMLTLSVQTALKLISRKNASVILSSYFEMRIKKIVGTMNLPEGYFIAALGSFALVNMNFASDIDLLVVSKEYSAGFEWQKTFTNFLQKAKLELNPFNVDFRLRPEGKSSPIVWDIENYNKYLDSRARVWEFQSLLKLKFICGSNDLFNQFKESIILRVAKFTSNELKREIVIMSNAISQQASRKSDGSINIKTDKGALQTVDFILQYFCLRNIKLFKKVLGKDSSAILSGCKEQFINDDFIKVFESYNYLKQVEFIQQNIFNIYGSTVSSNLARKNLLAHFLNFGSAKEFEEKLTMALKSNNSIFEKYLGD